MKDIIGKSKTKSKNIPRKLIINKMDVYNKHKTANAFNDFFENIGQKVASQIPKSPKIFERYINKVNVIMDSKPLSMNQLKDAFFWLKIIKSSGVNDIRFPWLDSILVKKPLGCLANP